jgi:hypothetical protein
MKTEEFYPIARVLAAAFPKAQATAETQNLYYALLKDLPAEVVMAAVLRVISEWEYSYLPPVATIRKAAVANQVPPGSTPDELWESVTNAIRKHGYNNPAKAEADCGPLAWTIVQKMGGWQVLCQSENTVADRAHFLKMAGSVTERGKQQAAALPQVEELTKLLSNPNRKQLEAK